MRWKGRKQSRNVIDSRGKGSRGGGKKAISGVGIVVALVAIFIFNQAPEQVLNDLVSQGQSQTSSEPRELTAAEREMGEFVGVVLRDTEAVWEEIFQMQFDRSYQQPQLEMFSGRVDTACGTQSSAVGPFYCPGDYRIYLDTSFFQEMETRLNAPGDFAQAYVIAHEVGHHVQKLIGVSDKVSQQRARSNKVEANRLSVRQELQADYFAGVWAHHAQRRYQYLEPGDIEEALNAANAIGDDKLQKQARGVVVPDSFTHGTSAQRIKWFKLGFQSGDIRAHDPFKLPYSQL